MGNIAAFILVYMVGGITFVPSILVIVLLHAYWSFPQVAVQNRLSGQEQDSEEKRSRAETEEYLSTLPNELQRIPESDVAASYFAVCREYVPGGVNGRPPERTTPAGAVVTTESPSVYQSMYRSIFDRKSGVPQDHSHPNGKPFKRARNIFFVVLRHGHLMLYEDAEQLEVKHVIPLEHHDVSIYGGEGVGIPEGELWIKRNAIRLQWDGDVDSSIPVSQPYFLFSENCCDKEDFYFAILQNKKAKSKTLSGGPTVQHFDLKHIIGLVQKLHSSEEQIQTRWLNALVGRIFLAMYKTQDAEDYIRSKITKKIARVKKPAFLSGIVLEKIDMGEGGPYITNPKLKDLTVDGGFCAEMDVKYAGNFRIEISTRVRIDLGARFKVREVDLLLAVVVKKIQGHALIKIKPPPSNRLWMTFETMPLVELSIEPLVSSRQITYSIILRAIESRIKEVIAETCVLPHWDDGPFKDTSDQRYRGGIWAKEREPAPLRTHIRTESYEAGVEQAINEHVVGESPLQPTDDRAKSSSALPDTMNHDLRARKTFTLPLQSSDETSDASSASVEKRPPKVIRSRSFASAADPLLSTDSASAESKIPTPAEQSWRDATASMKAISTKSPPSSPSGTPSGTPTTPSSWQHSQRRKNDSISSVSSARSLGAEDHSPSHGPPKSPNMPNMSSISTSLGSRSMKSSSIQENFGLRSHQPDVTLHAPGEKRYSTASLSAATAAAKKWGWDVMAKASDRKSRINGALDPNRAGTPDNPIGASHPHLEHDDRPPLPDRQGPHAQSSASVPKRKPVPAPLTDTVNVGEGQGLRKRRQESHIAADDVESPEDGLLVVAAPHDSEPSTPTTGNEPGE